MVRPVSDQSNRQRRRRPPGGYDPRMTTGLLLAFAAYAGEHRTSALLGPLVQVPGTVVWMMEHEVTQAEWRAVYRDNPSGFDGCDQCPVERVTWSAAVAFGEAVTRIEDTPFRLPTEEEWNAAAGPGPYAGGDDPVRVAWFA